jgi:hypothetical protein
VLGGGGGVGVLVFLSPPPSFPLALI